MKAKNKPTDDETIKELKKKLRNSNHTAKKLK
jgi:hypothetical protein